MQTVSVAPPMPRHVPEGDLKKIEAMSWLLDHPDMRTEAAEQVRHALVPLLLLLLLQLPGHKNSSDLLTRGVKTGYSIHFDRVLNFFLHNLFNQAVQALHMP